MSCHFLFQDHRPLIHDTGPTTFTTLPQSIHPRSTRRNGDPPAPPASTASGLLPPSSLRYVSSSPPGSTSPRPSSASHVFSTSTGPAPTHCHCLSLLQETQGQSKCPIVQSTSMLIRLSRFAAQVSKHPRMAVAPTASASSRSASSPLSRPTLRPLSQRTLLTLI